MISEKKLLVKQEVEMLEIFTNFETKNKYSVYDEQGNKIYYAYEEAGLLSRLLLKHNRPLALHVIDSNKNEVLNFKRPFFFFFPDHFITENGSEIGSIKRKFAWLSRVYEIEDKSGNKYECISKFTKIWTFNITKDGQEIASIKKKWSGLGKEMFADADNFEIDFGTANSELKKIILALAFAIDLDLFEQNHKN